LNNSFSIIVGAIEEGRRIIDNLKKSLSHLLSKSFHDVFIITAAILVGTPLPILPVQILWTNIVQEGLLTFGFAFEPAEGDVMQRDPRSSTVKTILSADVRRLILIAGIVTGVFSVALYFFLLFSLQLPISEIRTIMFVVLSLDGIFFTLSLKQLHQPLWKINILSNTYLLFAMGMSLALLIATLLIPALRTLLSLEILVWRDVVLLAGVALFNLFTIEVAKYIVFQRKRS
jgi:Ca2+-transporting ATPase